MTTGVMTYTWQNVIDDALYQAGKKDIGNAAETELITIATRMLNGMLKYWQSRGVQLHTVDEFEIPLYGSKQSYTIKMTTGDLSTEDRPMRLISAHRRDNTSLYEIPIDVISLEEYHEITIKSIVGPTTKVAVLRGVDVMTLYIWPIADAATALAADYTLLAHVQRAVNVAETGSLTATPDFPSEQYLAAVYGLADLMCKGKPEITTKAKQYFNEMLMTDQEPVSLFFHPEIQ
jgi:hypothetical protein